MVKRKSFVISISLILIFTCTQPYGYPRASGGGELDDCNLAARAAGWVIGPISQQIGSSLSGLANIPGAILSGNLGQVSGMFSSAFGGVGNSLLGIGNLPGTLFSASAAQSWAMGAARYQMSRAGAAISNYMGGGEGGALFASSLLSGAFGGGLSNTFQGQPFFSGFLRGALSGAAEGAASAAIGNNFAGQMAGALAGQFVEGTYTGFESGSSNPFGQGFNSMIASLPNAAIGAGVGQINTGDPDVNFMIGKAASGLYQIGSALGNQLAPTGTPYTRPMTDRMPISSITSNSYTDSPGIIRSGYGYTDFTKSYQPSGGIIQDFNVSSPSSIITNPTPSRINVQGIR